MRPAPGPGWFRLSCSVLLALGLAWAAPAWTQDRGGPGQGGPGVPRPGGKAGKLGKAPGSRPLLEAGRQQRAQKLAEVGDEDDDEATDEVTLSERYQAEGLSAVHMALKQGLYRSAAARLRALLELEPDNSTYHALLGQAWSKEGEYADALACFTFAQGDLFYETFGIGQHADTLRALGRPLEAAALRGTQLALLDNLADESHVLVEMAWDHEAAGDLARAEDLLLEALAVTPRSAKALAAMGELALRQGQDDDAWFYFWRARLSDASNIDTQRLGVRLLIEDQRYKEAEEMLGRMRRRFPKLEVVVLLRAEVSLRTGTPTDALNMLNMHRWAGKASPEMLAMRARLQHAAGQPAEVDATMRRAWAVYSHHKLVQAAAREVGWAPPGR